MADMTYEKLKEYCTCHMCSNFLNLMPEKKCKYGALCARFVKKYGDTPAGILRKGSEVNG